MSRISGFIAASLGLLSVFALSACSEAPSDPLRVGINPWPGYGPLFLAAEKGFFAEEGVDVELVELTSLTDVRRAFERGQVDGMTSSLVEVLDADRASDRRPVISLMTDYSNGADVVLARDGIPDVATLRGKRIGLEASSLNRFVLSRALAAGGLTIADVQVVDLPQLAIQEAVVDGTVDAVVTYPPMSVDIERTGMVSHVFSSADIPGEVADIVSFDRTIVQHRPEDVDAFVRAWGRAVAYVENHPAEAHEIIGQYLGISADDLAAAYEGVVIIPADQQDEFLRSDGPLADSILTLTAILWPEETEGNDKPLSRFFRRSAAIAWTGAE